LFFLFIAGPALRAASADRIDLKDGTHVDGLLLYAEERPDTLVVNVATARGAVERREVPKSEVTTIAYGDGTDDPAFLVVLPADSRLETWYAERLRHDLDPWLVQYPKSPRLAEMQARRAAFEVERQRVAGGAVRRGDRWLSQAEAVDWAPELEAQALLPALNETARQADATRLQTLLPQVVKAARTPSYPALVRAALPAFDACAPLLQPGSYTDALNKKLAFYESEQERCAVEIRSVINEKVLGYTIRPGAADDYVQVGDQWYRKDSYVAPYSEFTHYYTSAILDQHVAVALSEDTLATLRGWLQQIDDAKAQAAGIQNDLRDSDAALRKMADAFKQWQAQFSAEPVAQKEAVVAAVRGGGEQIEAGNWAGAEPILIQANKDWPNNLIVPLTVTDKAPLFLARIDAALQAGRLAEAEQLLTQTARFVPYLLAGSARARDLEAKLKDSPARTAQALIDHLRDVLLHRPFAEFLQERAALQQTIQRFHQARAETLAQALEKKLSDLERDSGVLDALSAQTAFDQHDYAPILEARDKLDGAGTPEGIRVWYRDLRVRVQDRIDASDAELGRVNGLLLHLNFLRAHAAIGHATEIWPGNPGIESKTHCFQLATGLGGGLVLCVILYIVLVAWNAISTMLEAFRYKVAKKKYARQGQGQKARRGRQA
jgi:hypothetical protein